MMGYRKFLPLLVWLLCCVFTSHARKIKETLIITWEQGAPDGRLRDMIKVNGQFPAPSLAFDEDDDVEMTVINRMPQNTTIHWHGLLMNGTPWSDGVPGLTQTPIEPGETFIYRFRAYPPGQYWYHSHSRLSLIDGLYGSLQIRRKPHTASPWSLISRNPRDIEAMDHASRYPSIMLVSDWDHMLSNEYYQVQADSSLGIFCVDSILLNGKGSVFCPGQTWLTEHQNFPMLAAWPNNTVTDKGCYPFVERTEGPPVWLDQANYSAIPPGMVSGCQPSNGPVEVIEVDPQSGWVSLNFISASTFKGPTPSIDQHSMWFYEVDGQFIIPFQSDSFTIRAGERFSVMVKLDQKPQDYVIRIPDFGTQLLAAYAILRYTNSPKNLPVTQEQFITYRGNPTTPWLDYNCDPLNNATFMDRGADLTNFAPFPSTDPNLKPAIPTLHDQQFVFNITRVNITWKTSMNYPYLTPMDNDAYTPLLYQPNSTEGYDSRYVIRTKNNTWVDLVAQVGDSSLWPTDFPHPMHKHSSKMWLIAVGNGLYNYSSVYQALQDQPSAFNLMNPAFRDTHATGFNGEQWFVMRYHVTNPGPFLFHCHIETHLAAGMGIAILDGVDAWPYIPPEYGINQHGLTHTHHRHFVE